MIRKLLGWTAAALAVSGAAGSAQAQEIDRIRWQIPLAVASNLTALGDTAPWVADQLRRATGGQIDLQLAEPGAVIPALAVFENVSTGAIDAGYSPMGYEIGQIPASSLYGATPFGLEPVEFVAWMDFHGGRELLEELYNPHGVKPILCGTVSPEAAGWFRAEIESVEDLQGLRMRAFAIGGEIMSELGMSVTMMPGGELYQALETGVLDATEFSLPTIDEQLGFYQVARYYYLPGWHQPATNNYLYVNADVWNSLSETTQAIIEITCQAANTRAFSRAEALQGAALARFEEAGVTLGVLDDEMLLAFYEATETIMERRSQQDEMFGRVYQSMLNFQREHALWKELGYLPRDWLRRNVYEREE